MDERTEVVLAKLYGLVEQAKAVPMSASCMVNRKEVLELITSAREALRVDVGEAQRITENSLATLERAQQEAELIIRAAEEKAVYLADQTEIMAQAKQRAHQVELLAIKDADAFKRETDAYIDQRIAGFEAALQKTINQVQTMRTRLADRSQLDVSDTQALPQLIL
ncbi:MAG: hypothetical protein LBI99_10780 [Propionibacteriaceae bacterium]|jgi:hypothetical protein|nr:hypothetical protein [Propionibacteriaceae bacterium]